MPLWLPYTSFPTLLLLLLLLFRDRYNYFEFKTQRQSILRLRFVATHLEYVRYVIWISIYTLVTRHSCTKCFFSDKTVMYMDSRCRKMSRQFCVSVTFSWNFCPIGWQCAISRFCLLVTLRGAIVAWILQEYMYCYYSTPVHVLPSLCSVVPKWTVTEIEWVDCV
jgi:hypothetical protein